MADYKLIDHCQICAQPTTEVFSLGNLPLVDDLVDLSVQEVRTSIQYPSPVLYCRACRLVQLGCIVDHQLLFPVDYPYTSSTTRILCDNFADLARAAIQIRPLTKKDLVIDIGCNDGALLNHFKSHGRVLGITPENVGQRARQKGIEVIQSYFNSDVVTHILSQHGQAAIVTATNVFAHIEDINQTVLSVLKLLSTDGIFISESGYLFSLLEKFQLDTIHHEHLRYYSLTSLKYLLERHGLEIFHAQHIRTHGGSLRVYAARRGQYPVTDEVERILKEEEQKNLNEDVLKAFYTRATESLAVLKDLLMNLKKTHARIDGIGAPGRATVLIHCADIDETILCCIRENKGSSKIGKCVPGTKIQIVDEDGMMSAPPDYALILSWHFAQELMKKLKALGFQGDFIIPLPKATIIPNKDIQ